MGCYYVLVGGPASVRERRGYKQVSVAIDRLDSFLSLTGMLEGNSLDDILG